MALLALPKEFKKLHNILLFALVVILPVTGMKPWHVTFLSTLSFSLLVTPVCLRKIASYQKYGQPIRDDGPKGHLITKKNTPTMGGLIIIGCGVIGGLISAPGSITTPLLYASLCFGGLGFVDDFIKIKLNNSKGLRAQAKFLAELVMGLLISMSIYSKNPAAARIFVPGLGLYDIGSLFVPFATLTIVGTANAFNLTDGLDGLAVGQFSIIILFLIVALFGFGAFGWLQGLTFAQDMSLFLVALLASALCFWFHNTYPARIFMGDVGSLALGAIVGTAFAMCGLEIVLLGLGIVPVLETLSVIAQVSYFKKTKGGRLFLMAPIHHHFEKLNIHENRITLAAHLIAAVVGFLIMV